MVLYRSSPSRVVGGRWLRQVRRASHGRRSKRTATSPLSRSASRHSGHSRHSRHSEHSGRAGDTERDPDTHSRAELRRSSRLVSALPRSDYSLTERWSYGADVYETRCDPDHHKAGDASKTSVHTKRGRTSSHDKKKRKRRSVSHSPADDCVAHCTRSRTALKSCESVCEPLPDSLKAHSLSNTSLNQNATATSAQLNHTEGGLLPLDERDFAYSPFSSSTVTDLLDSDYSVYSPRASRRKGKKRKRSGHRSLSNRKSNYLINIEDCRKKLKIDPQGREVEDTSREAEADSKAFGHEAEQATAHTSCSYQLRNRPYRDSGLPTSTVTSETGN